jgi:hypothetical protein
VSFSRQWSGSYGHLLLQGVDYEAYSTLGTCVDCR